MRVLVVDDDFMVARVHRKFVERVPGFEVVAEARSGEAALAAVREHRPDLVLLDIYLPDMTGLEVLRSLRAQADPVDVLVVSAARDLETVQEAFRGGAVQYLIKPFTAEVMRERLTEFARRRRSVQAAATQGDGEMAQREVDALFGGQRAARPGGADLPKGLTVQTLQLVARALKEQGAAEQPTLSAAECAEQVGLARVSVRRYLEHLAETGRAEVGLRYGQAGRPERRYRWLG
ncbi:response regulator [Nocardioides mesophilus]|uniref:Transcriptional regulatory protein n=1 Tax=Nocardioides mesophilus TaxID=433659 RepID=A0A7G9RGY0_9ACTN|nr:response regulator [Nocardioides mesophilus]